MKAFLRIDGAEDLAEALAALPADLARDGAGLLIAAAEAATGEMTAAYPEVSGNLKRGVGFKVFGEGLSTVVRVYSMAPHAHLYEYGTQARHTAIGANRGAMPAGHVFWPIFDRWERNAQGALSDLLRATGLRVTDHAA